MIFLISKLNITSLKILFFASVIIDLNRLNHENQNAPSLNIFKNNISKDLLQTTSSAATT